MAERGIVFPLLPGKRPALDAFASSLMGPRSEEYAASQASILKESWYLQTTPAGEMLVVYFEAPDPAAVFSGLAASEEPFDIWFRDQCQDITGIDMKQMSMPALPEQVFTWAKS